MLLLLILANCGDKERRSKSPIIRKITKVTSPEYGAVFALNDTIDYQISTLQDSVSVDSFLVKNGTVEVFNSNNSNGTSIITKTGITTLRFIVFLSNGKKEQHNQKVTFLSDISPKDYTFQKVNTYAHDPEAYTQGLFYENGFLYESTGEYGHSSLRKVEISSGKTLKKTDISSQYFGEGIATIGNKIFMLTYKSRRGFIYDKNTFEQIGTFNFYTETTEGWGIAAIGDSLIISDGSENLYFLNPETLTETSRIQVYDQYRPIKNLNELEFIKGKIYANIYQTEEIAIIDPITGKLEARISLAGIFDKNNYSLRLDVLNGIAYDMAKDRLFVTGKLWPKLYEIEIIESSLNQ